MLVKWETLREGPPAGMVFGGGVDSSPSITRSINPVPALLLGSGLWAGGRLHSLLVPSHFTKRELANLTGLLAAQRQDPSLQVIPETPQNVADHKVSCQVSSGLQIGGGPTKPPLPVILLLKGLGIPPSSPLTCA